MRGSFAIDIAFTHKLITFPLAKVKRTTSPINLLLTSQLIYLSTHKFISPQVHLIFYKAHRINHTIEKDKGL